MMKYKKPKCLAGSTKVTPQICEMGTKEPKSNPVTPVTFTKVAPRTERSCVYNPKRRTLEKIESDIAAVEARIAKGIDIGPEWNRIMNRYNSLLVEHANVLNTEKQGSSRKK